MDSIGGREPNADMLQRSGFHNSGDIFVDKKIRGDAQYAQRFLVRRCHVAIRREYSRSDAETIEIVDQGGRHRAIRDGALVRRWSDDNRRLVLTSALQSFCCKIAEIRQIVVIEGSTRLSRLAGRT